MARMSLKVEASELLPAPHGQRGEVFEQADWQGWIWENLNSPPEDGTDIDTASVPGPFAGCPRGIATMHIYATYAIELVRERVTGLRMRCEDVDGKHGSSTIPIMYRGELEVLASQIVCAWDNRGDYCDPLSDQELILNKVTLDFSLTEVAKVLKSPGSKPRDQVLREKFAAEHARSEDGSFPLADRPTAFLDSEDRVVAWYLPGAFSSERSRALARAVERFGDDVLRLGGERWRANRENFADPERCVVLPGNANMSICWYNQGHNRSTSLPGPSANLRTAEGQRMLRALRPTLSIIASLLAVIHPEYYDQQLRVFEEISKRPDKHTADPGVTQRLLKYWCTPFEAFAIIANRETEFHRDTAAAYSVWTYLGHSACTAFALPGYLFEHGASQTNGERICIASFFRPPVGRGILEDGWEEILPPSAAALTDTWGLKLTLYLIVLLIWLIISLAILGCAAEDTRNAPVRLTRITVLLSGCKKVVPSSARNTKQGTSSIMSRNHGGSPILSSQAIKDRDCVHSQTPKEADKYSSSYPTHDKEPRGIVILCIYSLHHIELVREKATGVPMSLEKVDGDQDGCRIPLTYRSQLDVLASQITRAWNNRVQLDFSLVEVSEALKSAGSRHRDQHLRNIFATNYPLSEDGSLPLVDEPTVFIDSDDRVVAWYLPGVLSSELSAHMIRTLETYGKDVLQLSGERGEERRESLENPKKCMVPSGNADFSICCYAQGRGGHSSLPGPSAALSTKAGCEVLRALRKTMCLIGSLLLIIHPECYAQQMRVFREIYQRPDMHSADPELTQKLLDNWYSPFDSISLSVNREIESRRNYDAGEFTMDILGSFGTYQGGRLEVPLFGRRFSYNPGTIFSLPGYLFEHGTCKTGGDGISVVGSLRPPVGRGILGDEWREVLPPKARLLMDHWGLKRPDVDGDDIWK
ncbi:hypothetical protein NMY22_g5751 [Coprinellus aureogranulatus]|nr:hypothetical protein NMY22_g5751 [Coprinellus aureogranulatus]